MITETDGYLSLIEYLTEHLALFAPGPKATGNELSIKEFIENQMGDNLMALFAHHQEFDSDLRLQIIQEADMVVADLLEVLSNRQQQRITNEQQTFICDFVALLKNMFDAQIHAKG